MTLYGPSVPIRVHRAELPDPGSLAEPRPGERPDCEPVAPARAHSGDPEPVSVFVAVDDR